MTDTRRQAQAGAPARAPADRAAATVEPQPDLAAEITALRASLAGEADAIGNVLRGPLLGHGAEPGSGPEALIDLGRQLEALRRHVAVAVRRDEGPLYLRAELATLLSLARTLRANVEACGAAFEKARRGVELREQNERAERERLAAERGAIVRRRDSLQAEIDQTAAQMAQAAGGDCRRSVPIRTLADGITVCSSAVVYPRRRFRSTERWLVTLDDTHHRVVIKRSYA